MNFTIDRERWCRGADPNPKLVREADGRMCCLGFFLLACGVEREELLDQGEPQEPFQTMNPDPDCIPKVAKFLVHVEVDNESLDELGRPDVSMTPTNDATDLMSVNDDDKLDEARREEKIARLFAKQGVGVTFVDGPTPLAGTATKEG